MNAISDHPPANLLADLTRALNVTTDQLNIIDTFIEAESLMQRSSR